MANAVIILGKSGTGKSSSIKTLNPKANPEAKGKPFYLPC